MKKKLLATLLSVSMVMGIAACGSSTADNTTTDADTTGAQTQSADTAKTDTSAGADAAAIDTSEHVVISYMTTGDPPESGSDPRVSWRDHKGCQRTGTLSEKCNESSAGSELRAGRDGGSGPLACTGSGNSAE